MNSTSSVVTFIAHLRPRSWPVVALHFAAGWAVAAGCDRAGPLPGASGESGDAAHVGWLSAAALAALWAVFLNGGTLGLNSAIDRDTDSVGYLEHPPPPLRGQAWACLAWMGIGGIASGWLCAALTVPYGICVALSVLYSVPPVRLKARPGWDLAVNMTGYGALTFLGGALAGGARAPLAWGALGGAFAALFAALYPLTQLYQLEQDRAAGVRTLALSLGRRGCLDLAIAAALVAHGLMAFALARLGVRGVGPYLVGASATGWMILLARWRTGRVVDEQRAMYWGTRLYGLADVVVVVAALSGAPAGVA